MLLVLFLIVPNLFDMNKAIVFLYFVLPIFSQQVRVGGRNKNKNFLDHFPIELKSKETRKYLLVILPNGIFEF